MPGWFRRRKDVPRALSDQTRAMGTGSDGPRRTTELGGLGRPPAQRTRSAAEPSARSAGRRARARGLWGCLGALRPEKPREEAGWGRTGRSRGLTRGPAGSRESGAARARGKLGAGERGRWRALCWEERAVGLTGNPPDQVPDQ